MKIEKLVMMANQIAAFFAAQGEERAVPQIAAHIESFWDPRMRAAMRAHVAAGGSGLKPLALKALQQLAQRETTPSSGPAAGPPGPVVSSSRTDDRPASRTQG